MQADCVLLPALTPRHGRPHETQISHTGTDAESFTQRAIMWLKSNICVKEEAFSLGKRIFIFVELVKLTNWGGISPLQIILQRMSRRSQLSLSANATRLCT
jgi:hypothetical protein